MPRPEYEPLPYLTKRGKKIFSLIIKHIVDSDIIADIDTLELSMLCNSFDIYERMSVICNSEDGFTEMVTGKNGTFKQVRPEYTIMKAEYTNILKNSSKYGITPGDRAKIFGGLKKKERKSVTSDLD
jgi:P27 family predicted phage terminase small subunit